MRCPGSLRPGRRDFALVLGLIAIRVAFESASARAGDLDASRWSAKVDPPTTPLAQPSNKSFAIPFPGNFGNGGEATYPSVPSQ